MIEELCREELDFIKKSSGAMYYWTEEAKLKDISCIYIAKSIMENFSVATSYLFCDDAELKEVEDLLIATGKIIDSYVDEAYSECQLITGLLYAFSKYIQARPLGYFVYPMELAISKLKYLITRMSGLIAGYEEQLLKLKVQGTNDD